MLQIKNPESREILIDELQKWTEYRIWMLAGTQIGDGPISYPVIVKTDEDGRFFETIKKYTYLYIQHIYSIYYIQLYLYYVSVGFCC